MNEEIDVSGCEFQSDCIEYKDISYLKVMPICAIHELSIACHDKVNKCKYYTLYTQLKRLKEENNQMKERLNNCEKFFNELGELLNEEVGNAYWTQAILHKIKNIMEAKLEKIKKITTKYSQHEGYLLDSLLTDLVDELREVLKDE